MKNNKVSETCKNNRKNKLHLYKQRFKINED